MGYVLRTKLTPFTDSFVEDGLVITTLDHRRCGRDPRAAHQVGSSALRGVFRGVFLGLAKGDGAPLAFPSTLSSSATSTLRFTALNCGISDSVRRCNMAASAP